jgi:aspartyl-tRNA(Asn)/glutamyl-tRNA(Gln) amidotransferase subunit A
MASEEIARTVAETLDLIAAENHKLNAYIKVFSDTAMAQARALDEELRAGRIRGPIHGRTVSLKDLIDVAGEPTTAASHVRRGHVAATDAVLVSRLREAGAVLIGKCNLHEFAFGTIGDESAFGRMRNPRDLSRSPGGSSGGSAAAVAAALCWGSIGSDTGGSIRIPAAACGVVGLKPELGELPMTGVVPLSVSLDHVGPIGRSVADVWLLYGALKGTHEMPNGPTPPGRLRLGVLGGYFTELLAPDVRDAFDLAIERLKDAGVSCRDVRLNQTNDIAKTYFHIVLTEAYAYHMKTLASLPEQYSPGVRERLQMGREISADAYVEAQRVRGLLRDEVTTKLRECDALVLPTLAIPAPVIGHDTVDIDGVVQPLRPIMLRLTQLFNLTGHPALSLPCGTTAEGLPCGLQLVGRHGATSSLLGVAFSCEPYVSRF